MKKQDLKIGMYVQLRSGSICVITFRNGNHDFIDVKNGSWVMAETDILDDLTAEHDCEEDKNYDIMKVWKNNTMKELLWERKTEILDKVEKRYFENFLKPFKNFRIYIGKYYSDYFDNEFIVIMINGHKTCLPMFKKGTMYKGMESGKEYTIKELGLFESKYKITLKEFFESKEKLAIHCDTLEKAKQLLKAFDKLGKKWRGGTSYLMRNNWGYSEEKTCYSNTGFCGEVTKFTDHKFKIYEFEEVDLKE